MKTKQILSHIRLMCVAVAPAVCATACCCGQGTLILSHSGSLNPTNEGFTIYTSGSPSLSLVMNDLGYNAWSITNHGADIAGYYENLTPEQAASLSMDWTLSLTLLVGGPIDPGRSGIFADLFTGKEYFNVRFGSLTNGDPVVDIGRSHYVLTGAGSGYHNYKLTYDTATDLASFSADGTPWLTGIQGASSINSATLGWGIGQHNSSSSYYANWNEVSLLAIPEPSTGHLVLPGCGVLFYLRRKYRR